MMTDLTGVILAGGKSRRFGSDKALHRVEGKPMIQRAHDVLIEVAHPVYISVASQSMQYDLPAPHIVDAFPNAGPLAGIHAALSAAQTSWILVLAVDLPFITPSHLMHLVEACDDSLDAVIATSPDMRQPLCGCYHRRIAPRVASQIENGQLAVFALIDRLTVRVVELPSKALKNINAAEDV